MDYGIGGRTALVCASSQGLGLACASALAAEGVHIYINGRNAAKLEAVASTLRAAHSVEVTAVAADLCSESGRQQLLAACPDPDILVNNNAGPPPGVLADWTHDACTQALEANLITAAMLIQATLPGMRHRGFGRIVNITSAMVKTPHAAMGLSTAARAGLTALSKALAREAVVDNVTLNNLLPERFDTARQEAMIQRQMKIDSCDHATARQTIANTIPAGRFGRPEEFGAACAFLCSAQAGFMTGQNLQLDGGAYSGLI